MKNITIIGLSILSLALFSAYAREHTEMRAADARAMEMKTLAERAVNQAERFEALLQKCLAR